jgi:hypothetical protein
MTDMQSIVKVNGREIILSNVVLDSVWFSYD